MDKVKLLAELALSARLKRLSERLARDVSGLYKKLNIDFEAKWFIILSALREESPMRVTDLAETLGITHTAVNQLAGELIKKEYISSVKGRSDERQRLLRLTEKGRILCKKLDPVWNHVKEANTELIENAAPGFMEALSRIEEELDKRSMLERIWMNMFGSLPGELKIVDYNAKMKKYFRKLNYEWLEQYFTVEDKDKNLLLHPKEKIIKHGGSVLFALLDDEVVGTCALIKHYDGKMELAKMAVTMKYQNKGIGRLLMQAALDRARINNAQELYLMTSKKLTAANVLYKKFGFRKVKNNPFGENYYERETFIMKMHL